jgi:hypothetical protein
MRSTRTGDGLHLRSERLRVQGMAQAPGGIPPGEGRRMSYSQAVYLCIFGLVLAALIAWRS